MAEVSLTSGIRANLLQLQNSSDAFQTTTGRLASGKKVTSAIDNPTNFFASVNLTDRAEGLSARLDGIGQSIQTIKAADNGIGTIRSFLSAMKGVVNNAIGNSDAEERGALGRQFNELVVQIGQTAKDSEYSGVNLLQDNTTSTVQFNEQFDDSKLDVLGFDVAGPGSDGLAEVDADGNIAAAGETAVINVASTAAVAAVAEATVSGYSVTANGADVENFNGVAGYAVTGSGNETEILGTASAAEVVSAEAGTATASVGIYIGNQTGGDNLGIQGSGTNVGSVDWGSADYKNELAAVVQQIEAFDSELKVQSGNLSQNLAAITIREEFSNTLINTLNEGSDKLILADLNEEGANLLALQTSTQLATQSLSLASQQSQGVLQLLG